MRRRERGVSFCFQRLCVLEIWDHPGFFKRKSVLRPFSNSLQQHANETEPTDNSTTINTAGDTIMMINLDELQLAYESNAIQTQLQLQIAKQHKKMEQMRQQLMQTFKQQLKQLKLKMEMNAMQMFNDFGQQFQVVMQKLEELVDECEEIKSMIEDKMTQILKAIQHTASGDITPTISNTPHRPQKISCAMPSPDPRPQPMSIDHPTQANGSLINSLIASHTKHQPGDSIALASMSK